MSGAAQAAQQYVTFHVGQLLLGVEIERVQEIIRHQQITPVPRASPVIRGLINLRGRIVTAIDLRRRLGLTGEADLGACMNVVLAGSGGTLSLLVDRVGDVLAMDADDFELPPQTMGAAARGLVRGAYKLERQLMLVLALDRVLHVAREANAAAKETPAEA